MIPVLHDEFSVQWDGEPKMGGGFHICSIGTVWYTYKEAREAVKRWPSAGQKPGLRIMHRVASEWVSE